MAWNSSTSNKGASAPSGKALGPGAPIAMNPGLAGKAYHDMWDIVGDCPLREIRVIFLYF